MDKHNNQKETISTILSVVITLAAFMILLMVLHFQLLLAMGISVVLYIALAMILRPVERIGKIDISTLNNGEALHEKLQEAGEDMERIKKCSVLIRDTEIRDSARELLKIAESILKYLTDHPQKIAAARRYIDYYQETAANVVEHYVIFQDTQMGDEEMQKTRSNTLEALRTLKEAFELQFQKLMQNEIMDMEADLNLLKQTLQSEGYKTLSGRVEK